MAYYVSSSKLFPSLFVHFYFILIILKISKTKIIISIKHTGIVEKYMCIPLI